MDDLEPWEREGYSREEVGKPVACMFCGMEVAWRDVDPLWVTIESAPEAQRSRDVGRLGAIGWTMYAHTVCLVERLDSPPPFLGAAIKRIRPPGTP